jgi:hypothetical protein
MALCRLCHRSFDGGLMSVGASYEVLVSRRVRMDQNMPGHMLTLADRLNKASGPPRITSIGTAEILFENDPSVRLNPDSFHWTLTP